MPSPKTEILITGGAGYIGSHVALHLLDRYRVVVADNLSRGHRELVPASAEFHQVDLRDRPELLRLFRAHNFGAVIHLAGLAYVGESMDNPAPYFEHNVTAAQNLLDAMVSRQVAHLVFSSTCAVYGIPQTLPLTESHPLAPINPYGESKAIIERFLPWYDHAYRLRSVALRYFNAAGADGRGRSGEWHTPEPHLLPNLLTAAATDGPFTIYGTDYPTPDGTCIRDYVHVTDLAAAHAAALRYLLRGGASQVFNLGTGAGISVQQAVAAVQTVLQRPIATLVQPRRAGDPPALVADAGRARQQLGWRARHSGFLEIVETAWKWQQRPKPELARPAHIGV